MSDDKIPFPVRVRLSGLIYSERYYLPAEAAAHQQLNALLSQWEGNTNYQIHFRGISEYNPETKESSK